MPANISVQQGEVELVREKDFGGEGALKVTRVDLPLVKVVEAALFVANRELTTKKLSKMFDVTPKKIKEIFDLIELNYAKENGPIYLKVKDDTAIFQVLPEYVNVVSSLSKESNLSKKATRILALIAKKGSILQSSLKKYFRGEIYAYTTELKDAGYVESKKYKNTRLLKPTKKFYDHFQFS